MTTSTEVEPDRMVVTSVLRALRLLELWVPWSPPKVSLEGGAMSSVLVAGTPDVQAHVSANVASGRRRTALPPVLFHTYQLRPECRWRVVLAGLLGRIFAVVFRELDALDLAVGALDAGESWTHLSTALEVGEQPAAVGPGYWASLANGSTLWT